MKRSFFFPSFLLVAVLAIHGQVGAAGEPLYINAPVTFGSGYTVSSGQFIDNSNSAYFLDPAATGTSLVVAGNVGIGTTPSYKLDISDSQTTDVPIVRLQNTNGADYSQGYWAISPNEGGHFTGLAVGQAFSARNAGTVGFYYAGAGSTSNYLYLGGHSVNDALVVQMTGNVGIGTTSPAEQFVVYGSKSGGFTNIRAQSPTDAAGNYSSLQALNSAGRAVYLTMAESSAGSAYYYHAGDATLAATANAKLHLRAGATDTGLTIDTSGNVGIGTTSPGYKLDVNGTGNFATSLTVAGATGGVVPSGAVMFFNLASCPSGWTELTSARGMYIVGLPASGTLAGTAGTALTNLENRATGQHNHGVSDPGHSHSYSNANVSGPGANGYPWGNPTGNSNTNAATTGISINNAGSVAGTNAPYIQLLVCQKS